MKLMADRIREAVSQLEQQEAGPPAGMQVPPEMAQQGREQGPLSVQQIEQDFNRIAQENPQAVQQIQQQIMAAMNSGELTAQELNQAVQLARAAMQNPEIYPQLRAFAIQQGMGEEADIPPQFDQGFLTLIILAGQAIQGGAPAGNQQTVPSFEFGGAVVGKQPGGAVVAEVHDGEFVVPAEVVRRIGLNKLEKMVESEQQRGSKVGLTGPGTVPSAMA